jgi:hypothetical protein
MVGLWALVDVEPAQLTDILVSVFDQLLSAAHDRSHEPPAQFQVHGPSGHLRAIKKDNLLGQIHDGAQTRGHVAASWIIEAISGIGGRPLAENFNQPA